MPKRQTEGSSGYDLCAFLDTPVTLQPMERKLIPTGLYTSFQSAYELQIRSRSGLAYKHGVVVLNAPGTIDSDYRGEIGVLLINLGTEPFTINNGDRIAQAVLCRTHSVIWNEVSMDEHSKSARGDGGFGHTGIVTH